MAPFPLCFAEQITNRTRRVKRERKAKAAGQRAAKPRASRACSWAHAEFEKRTLNEQEQFLRNLDLGEVAKWAKKLSAKAATVRSEVKPFKCY